MLGRLLLAAALSLSAFRPSGGQLTVVDSPNSAEVFYPMTDGPAVLTVLWDANVDQVDGYKVHYGTTSGNYQTHVDVGKVTSWKTPSLANGGYFFVVTAYRIDQGPTIDPSCVPPLGANAVSIFITKLLQSGSGVGSRAAIYFQLASPNSPLTALTVNVNSVPQKAHLNPDTDDGARWFTTPLQAGSYPVSLTATNAFGCSTTATKDGTGKPLTVTVK